MTRKRSRLEPALKEGAGVTGDPSRPSAQDAERRGPIPGEGHAAQWVRCTEAGEGQGRRRQSQQ